MRTAVQSGLAVVIATTMLVAALATAESTAPGTRYVIGVSGMH